MELLKEKDIKWNQFKNRLKNVPRTGWLELGIPQEHVESVYSHIASTKDLVIEYNAKFNLGLDIIKMDKMLTIKELVKAYTKEEKSVIGGSNSKEVDANIIAAIKEEFELDQSFIELYNEYIEQKSNEAIHALLFSKFESDLQVVDYYEKGFITLEAVYKDVEYYPENIKQEVLALLEKYPVAPLAWLTYDSKYYKNNELFTSLSNELINYCIKKYELSDQEKGL